MAVSAQARNETAGCSPPRAQRDAERVRAPASFAAAAAAVERAAANWAAACSSSMRRTRSTLASENVYLFIGVTEGAQAGPAVGRRGDLVHVLAQEAADVA